MTEKKGTSKGVVKGSQKKSDSGGDVKKQDREKTLEKKSTLLKAEGFEEPDVDKEDEK